MRTRRFYKYLMAMIIALGTTVNVFAQERGLKIYFSENVNGGTPQILVTDDNNSYDLPDGLTVTPEGVVWADKARYWEFFQQNVSDRVIADYTSSDKKKSRLRLTFGNFPYEVNMIQWNIMNDLLSASILDALDNYKITTKCIQSDGSGWQYTDEKWDMNFFAKNITFTQKDVPWKENAVLNGLTSFEIGEEAVGWRVVQTGSFLGIPTYGLRQVSVELDDKCRTFIKAGWNGQNGTNSNIADSDDSNWAFKVKFTLPDIRMRCKNIATGNVDDNIIVQEVGVHKIEGYISAHPGAVESKMSDPQDPDDFHFEYTASNNKITIGKTTGIIDKAKESGEVDVIVTLKRGTRVVSSYTQTIHVLAVSPEAPQIAIAFADGKKGYDITVGDTNAQVQGIITKNGKDLNGNPITNYSIYHYEYSVDNAGIATIDKNTGKITALKEGDVYVSAVLKDANGNSVTKTYTYLLHVFAPHEGLEFRRINTDHYTATSNKDVWSIANNTNSTDYDWQSNNLLRVNTSISGNHVTDVNDWKQIASFSTNSSYRWRAIAQEIAFDLYVPKYTMASATYSFAGNASIGTRNNGGCRYGFEFYYLNQGEQITQDVAYSRYRNRVWDTYKTVDITGTILRTGSDSYHSNIGDGDTYQRGTNNVDAADSYNNKIYTVYFAAMTYLYNSNSYSGDVSIGFKGIPEYTYYAIVTYKYNDGTDADWYTERIWSTSKTETKKLYEGTKTLPKRTGYTFLGWSTNPEATTPEYKVTTESDGRWSIIDGDFCPYDNVNGGGKGPVNLYAVWSAKSCTVILSHNGGPGESEQITAVYGQPMPESEDLVAPTWKGHDFNGYRQGISADPTIFYYDANMKSVRNYDQDRENYSIFADWSDHTTKVVFDSQGGNNSGVTQVTATYGEAMPTEGVQAPQRQGYTFGGYYSEANGQGTQYYTADMTSARTWNIDERLLDPQVTEVTLYAKWIGNTYAVTLDPQGGTGGTTSVTAAYGQPLPSGLTAPTKPGYEFKGYYSNANNDYYESIGQDSGGKQYYDKDMVGVADWDYTYSGVTLYAHWAPKTYIVTFNGTNGAIVPKQLQYDSQSAISDVIYNSDGVVKISFKYGGQSPSQITNGKFKKAGFKLVGFYDSNNVLVATVDVDKPTDRNIYFNESSGYWTRKDGNLVWNCTHDVNLTARYEPKYTVRDGDIIDFGTEYLEVGIDWENSMVHDLLGAALAEKEAGRISSTNPVMVFDIRNAKYLDNSSKKSDDLMVPLRDKDFISPNLLVYLGEGAYNVIENEIKTDGTCPGLVVTDRFPIKIPYAFKAGKALYERNKVQKDNNDLDDAMWKQSHESIWGTLCLPYPIKNNNTYNDVSKVIFYELRKKSGSVMQFKKLPENAEVPANTPVLYERTVGIGSAVTIEENAENIYNKNTWISVPKNQSYEAEVTSYANATEPSIRDWEFRGNLKTNVFCGKGYINPPAAAIANSDITNNGEVYYFKQNKFTRLTPSMEKNGVHYDAGMMTIYPYRAYFYQKGSSGSSAKVSAYSILVVDEFGNTTDITNTIFGDGEGDGKIYDLNGIRVMQPVKGRLYIVNGQKKVYR